MGKSYLHIFTPSLGFQVMNIVVLGKLPFFGNANLLSVAHSGRKCGNRQKHTDTLTNYKYHNPCCAYA